WISRPAFSPALGTRGCSICEPAGRPAARQWSRCGPTRSRSTGIAPSSGRSRTPPRERARRGHELPDVSRSDRAGRLRHRRAGRRATSAGGGASGRCRAGGGGGERQRGGGEGTGDGDGGRLDRLLIDLPPGVSRFLELCDLLPSPPEVLTVTIPTPESRDAVRRALRAAVERGARAIGVIENMTGPQYPGDAGLSLSQEF